MKHTTAPLTVFATLALFTAIFCGCSAAGIAQARADEQQAERLYTATTQATASARLALDSAGPEVVGTPAYTEARRAVIAAEKAQQAARAGLDLAKAALDAAAKNDPADPAFVSAVSRAVGAIPSPWTAVLASLIPAALPLAVSVAQAFKLGHARSTVEQVTQQLEQHKAALAKLTSDSKPT